MPITPGTWEVAKGGRSVNVGPHAKCRFEAGLDANELAANCRLIAAAPNLLKVCLEAAELLEGFGPGEVLDCLNAAIAKAQD